MDIEPQHSPSKKIVEKQAEEASLEHMEVDDRDESVLKGKGKRSHSDLSGQEAPEAHEDREESGDSKKAKIEETCASDEKHTAENESKKISSNTSEDKPSSSTADERTMAPLPRLPLDLEPLRPFVSKVGPSLVSLADLLESTHNNRHGETGNLLLYFFRLLDFNGLLLTQLNAMLFTTLLVRCGAPISRKAPFEGDLLAQLRFVMERWSAEGPMVSVKASTKPASAIHNLCTSALPILCDILMSLGIIDSPEDANVDNKLFNAWREKSASLSLLNLQNGNNIEGDGIKDENREQNDNMEPRETTLQKIRSWLGPLSQVLSQISRLSKVNHDIRMHHMDKKNPRHLLLVSSMIWTNRISRQTYLLMRDIVQFLENTRDTVPENGLSSLLDRCSEAVAEIDRLNLSPNRISDDRDFADGSTTDGASDLICRTIADMQLDLCIKNQQLNIGEQQMDVLFRYWTRKYLFTKLGDAVRSKRIDFPWKRYNMPDVQSLFLNLKSKVCDDPRNIKNSYFNVPGIQDRTKGFFGVQYRSSNDAKPQYFAFDSPKEDYERIDIITDYFQEKERMSGRVKNASQSPLEYWRSQGTALQLFDNAMRDRGDRYLSAHDVRELIFKSGVRECTQFKVTLVRQVIEKLGGTRMLDFSAGWGDRLIGAMGTSSIRKYVGVDPNLDLKPGHDEMVRTLAPPDRQQDYIIVYQPFQTANLPPGLTYDLIFTSPPYFDFEIYTDRPGQSILSHPGFHDWLVYFLLVSINKAWEVLDYGGHLAVHITDTKGAACCELMNLFIQARLPGSVYEGVIGSFGQRKDIARPIWVWRKDINAEFGESTRKLEAENLARTHYVKEWNLVNQQFGMPK